MRPAGAVLYFRGPKARGIRDHDRAGFFSECGSIAPSATTTRSNIGRNRTFGDMRHSSPTCNNARRTPPACDWSMPSSGEVLLPDTDTIVPTRYPGGAAIGARKVGTRREQLAIWMVSADNPYLAPCDGEFCVGPVVRPWLGRAARRFWRPQPGQPSTTARRTGPIVRRLRLRPAAALSQPDQYAGLSTCQPPRRRPRVRPICLPRWSSKRYRPNNSTTR